jgi:predicted TIM-barrel fold metal-dependent hydrolase
MTDTAREELTRRLELLESAEAGLVADGDTHISDPTLSASQAVPPDLSHPDDYYHGKPLSAEELLANMDAASIRMSLAWQNPATTGYTGQPEADYQALLAANRYVHDAAGRYPDRILPAGWTDPKALGLDGAKELVRRCVHELGFPVVKMNPAQNAFPINDPQVLQVVEEIVALGAVPAFHFGADTPYTPASGLAAVAQHIAPHPLIAIHMGGGGAGYLEAEALYRAARRIGLQERNIHFILSAKRETHMESDFITYEAAGEGHRTRLCCGSDAPYGLQAWNFAGFRALFRSVQSRQNHPDERVRSGTAVFSDESVAGYLGGNLANLYATGCRSVLAVHAAG